ARKNRFWQASRLIHGQSISIVCLNAGSSRRPQRRRPDMATQMKEMNVTATRNGLDLEQMVHTVEAINAKPEIAQFRFRARNRWITGGENRSTIRDFYGACAEDQSRDKPFEFTNGEPPVLLGNNEGANPVEFLLHALAGCVTTTTVLHA